MTMTPDGGAGRPKVAFYWCASCGGCEETVVDLHEAILDVVANVDLVFWPVALDFKRRDVEALPDGAIAVAFLNGAIRTTEHEEMAHLLRRKSRLLVAFGACAHLGGIPGLANLWTRDAIFDTVYRTTPSTDSSPHTVPRRRFEEAGRTVALPGFFETARSLGQVVPVDYTIPGCPPTPDLLAQAVRAVLTGQLPERGSVLAPDRAVCDTCPRKDTRPEQLLVAEFHRPHEVLIDEDKCLLAQGLPCLGAATRGGCEARCITGNMPCTGCFGPTSRVRDHGAKAMSAMASVLDATEEGDIDRKLDALADPMGTFFRYSLPGSLVARKVNR
jgi:F420-non-reducing hydrogenase small subunit